MRLSIGEVSKIFNISREALRFYDKIGILKPKINENNGYRYYEFKHLEKLGLIIGIKLLGVPLANIKETIESEDLNEYKNIVLKQEEILQVRKKELEILEYHLNKSKLIIDKISNFKNEYNFENLKITNQSTTLYAINQKDLLNSNLLKPDNINIEADNFDLDNIMQNNYVYILNIVENKSIIEDENLLFVKEDYINSDLSKKSNSTENINTIKEDIIGETISVDFYGSEDEIGEYILALNNYFDCPANNRAYVAYEFYLPKKNDKVMYLVNITLKI